MPVPVEVDAPTVLALTGSPETLARSAIAAARTWIERHGAHRRTLPSDIVQAIIGAAQILSHRTGAADVAPALELLAPHTLDTPTTIEYAVLAGAIGRTEEADARAATLCDADACTVALRRIPEHLVRIDDTAPDAHASTNAIVDYLDPLIERCITGAPAHTSASAQRALATAILEAILSRPALIDRLRAALGTQDPIAALRSNNPPSRSTLDAIEQGKLNASHLLAFIDENREALPARTDALLRRPLTPLAYVHAARIASQRDLCATQAALAP